MTALTFTSFRVWQVVVPARRDIISAPDYRGNVPWPDIPIHLVEGVTSEGIVAVGEADRSASQATPPPSTTGLAALATAVLLIFYLGILPTSVLDLAAASIATIF